MSSLQNLNVRISFTQPILLFRFSKRLFDIIFSLVFLILLIPILIVISIMKDKNESLLFKQQRAGMNGKPFNIYKIRSMKEDNKNKLPSDCKYNWENGVPDDFIFKSSTDFHPNMTRYGNFIRKYSIDELPQFFNVLIGDMSVIGPRPELIEIAKCYNENQKKRLFVKPGITGWAQVNGRSNSSHGEKIKDDLFYTDNQGFILEIKIFFKTIFQTVFGKDAF